MDEQVVYWIGFFVALAFIVFGADDVLWDVFALFRGTGKKRVKLSLINEKPPKMLAVVIASTAAVVASLIRKMRRRLLRRSIRVMMLCPPLFSQVSRRTGPDPTVSSAEWPPQAPVGF